VPQGNGLLEDLFLAARILVNEGVLDGFGHVSVRNPDQSGNYMMLRDNVESKMDEGHVIELDRDSKPVRPNGPPPSIERFIHGEIYRARPDVAAIVHTHAPALIPFGVSATPLRPLYHMCGFMENDVPIFDIAQDHGVTDMLVTSPKVGHSLARCLGQCALVLMRGHGATVVGASLKEAVFRAVYAKTNAQLQPIALQLGTPKYLSAEEARKADELHRRVLDRPWEYWKSKIC